MLRAKLYYKSTLCQWIDIDSICFVYLMQVISSDSILEHFLELTFQNFLIFVPTWQVFTNGFYNFYVLYTL